MKNKRPRIQKGLYDYHNKPQKEKRKKKKKNHCLREIKGNNREDYSSCKRISQSLGEKLPSHY